MACALVRATSRTAALEARGVELFVGSLYPAQGLGAALEAVDCVVHMAGGGMTTSTVALYHNNLETTRAICDASAALGRPVRVIFVSSLAARGPEGQPITHYGRAKLQAEAVALALPDRIHVTVLRPPAIYGPGDVRMLPVFKAAKRGLIPIPGPSQTTSLVHVRDYAAAITALLVAEHPGGQVYCVADGEVHHVAEMARRIAAAVGRKARVFRVPRPILWVAAAFAELVGRIRGKAALLTFDKVKDLSQPHWVCDAAPLTDATGWTAHIAFDDGARETADWYRSEGWL